MLTTLLLGLLLGLSLAAPLSVSTRSSSTPPFQITNMQVNKTYPGNVTINFTIYDPDPLTNTTANCTGTWGTGSKAYPQGPYKPCGESSFAWNIASITNVSHFILGVEHAYTDPSVGDPPYDQITNFGHANIIEPKMICHSAGLNLTCTQKGNAKIRAPIYASIAKRK